MPVERPWRGVLPPGGCRGSRVRRFDCQGSVLVGFGSPRAIPVAFLQDLIPDLAIARDRRDNLRDCGSSEPARRANSGAGPNGWRSKPAAMAEAGGASASEPPTIRSEPSPVKLMSCPNFHPELLTRDSYTGGR